MMRFFGLILFVLLPGFSSAQTGDLAALRQKIKSERPDAFQWTLPSPAGKQETFLFRRSKVLPGSLQEKYPDIMVFSGQHQEFPSRKVRLEYRPDGIHWMVVTPQERYTANYTKENGLRIDRESSEPRPTFACGSKQVLPLSSQLRSGSTQLEGEEWTLRLAITTTYEFTQYHGGTKAQTMAALATMVNRLNLVYERDLGVHFILAEGMDTLIIDEPDEFSFTAGSEDLDNQYFIDLRLGSNAYDIGHVVDIGGYGGYATLNVICEWGAKAKGYTSAPQGEGELFVIDYLAHELGHQFGATHTFNGVNGACRFSWQEQTAVEPGSGHTIMAYAGLCGNDNVAAASTPWFHAASIDQVRLYAETIASPGCGSLREIGHLPPVIERMPRGKVIPRATPFELTAQVIDPEGNQDLWYGWDQMDTGPANAIDEPGLTGPVFRYQPPDHTIEQIFPSIEGLLRGELIPGDILVDEPRKLQFQLVVRDQQLDGTRLARDTVSVRVTDKAGPFRMQGGTAQQSWAVGEIVPLSWAVAGTDQTPVSAATVDIWLSDDGGFTYEIPLAVNLPNNGEALVEVPDVACPDGCRVKIKAADHLFFALSPFEVTIDQNDRRTFSLAAIGSSEAICSADTAQVAILTSATSLEESIQISLDLPEGLETRFREKEVMPGERLHIDYWVTDAGILEDIQIGVNARLDSLFLTDTVTASVLRPVDTSPGQFLPADNSPMVSAAGTRLSWSSIREAQSYRIELRSGEQIVGDWQTDTSFWQVPLELGQNQPYEWRVTASNSTCPPGPASAWQTFTTLTWSCDTISQEGPFVFGTLPFTRVSIPVPETDVLTDLDVLAIDGSYPSPDNLEFRLISPAGTAIDLLRREEPCSVGGRFRFSFDDLFARELDNCIGGVNRPFKPRDPLSDYWGEDPTGDWELIAFHRSNDGGQIDAVTLEVCRTPDVVATEQVSQQPNAVRLYPNPARDLLRVDVSELTAGGSLVFTIFDARGRRVASGQWADRQNTLSLDGWGKGLYVLQLRAAAGQLLYRGRFVKL